MRELGMPLYQSWAQSILGSALLIDGDAATARVTLEEAKTAALLLDNPWLIAMADHWLGNAARGAGETTRAEQLHHGERKRPSVGWESLTPTEHRVVALAAEGLTNPQIAERLFVARGTVKVHLGHIFTKLAISTGAELAAEATRRAVRSE